MQTQLRGALEMSVAMVISGTIGWFVVRSGQPLPDLLFWRCVFGAATLLVVCLALGLLRRGLTLRSFALAAFGGVALVVNWVLIFAAFSHASISIATAVYNTQPFMLVALGALLLSERLTAMKAVWLCIAFAGVVLVAQAKSGGGECFDERGCGAKIRLSSDSNRAVRRLRQHDRYNLCLAYSDGDAFPSTGPNPSVSEPDVGEKFFEEIN